MIIRQTVSYTFDKKYMGLIFMDNFAEKSITGEKPDFLYLTARGSQYEAFPWYVRFGPGKEERKERYLRRRLPMEAKEERFVLGKRGLEVELPFTLAQLKGLGGEELKAAAVKAEETYGCEAVTGQARLLALFPEGSLRSGKYLPIYFVPEIVEEALKIRGIPKKEARLVLFDGETGCSAFLLRLLGKQYNYLTFVTENLNEECEAEIERLFDEYGLAVSLREGNVSGEIAGDVFLDGSGVGKKYCRAMPKGCYFIDLFGINDRRYLEGRLRDGVLCQSFLFGKREEEGTKKYLPQHLEAVCFKEELRPPFSTEKLWEEQERIGKEKLQILVVNGEKMDKI